MLPHLPHQPFTESQCNILKSTLTRNGPRGVVKRKINEPVQSTHTVKTSYTVIELDVESSESEEEVESTCMIVHPGLSHWDKRLNSQGPAPEFVSCI